MREATKVTQALGGNWYGSYGTAACPVCQPEGRKGQNALTISLGRKGILLHCKKSNCSKQALDAATKVATDASKKADEGKTEAEKMLKQEDKKANKEAKDVAKDEAKKIEAKAASKKAEDNAAKDAKQAADKQAKVTEKQEEGKVKVMD